MEPEDGEYNVHLSSSGSSLVANGIIIHVFTNQTSKLHKQLRLEMDGNSVKIKSNMESSVSGLYIVGDVQGLRSAYHRIQIKVSWVPYKPKEADYNQWVTSALLQVTISRRLKKSTFDYMYSTHDPHQVSSQGHDNRDRH